MLSQCVQVFSNIADIGIDALPCNALTLDWVGRKLNVQTMTTFRNPLADPLGTRRGPPLVHGPQFEKPLVCTDWTFHKTHARTRYRANSWATFASICDDVDNKLFAQIPGNSQHLLHRLLPPQRQQQALQSAWTMPQLPTSWPHISHQGQKLLWGCCNLYRNSLYWQLTIFLIRVV